MADPIPNAPNLEAQLRTHLRSLERVIVAYSGGVDSATLLAVATSELGAGVLAVTGRSPSVAQGETEAAAVLARDIGAAHEFIDTHEFDNPDYRKNDRARCFYCKDELFGRLTALARSRRYSAVLDGRNAEDGRAALDRRPGARAGHRWGIISPLAEAGFTKDDVRALAHRLGLSVWDKPATPCLSSRIPYGRAIDIDELRAVDLAERYLRSLGFDLVRVRHFATTARIEVPLHRVQELKVKQGRVVRALGTLGYEQVEIDPRGYRTGSLNER